jgi:hypothetical protein
VSLYEFSKCHRDKQFPRMPTVQNLNIIVMIRLIVEIRRKFAEEQFEFSKHAIDQSILRQIRVQEIREAIANGQVIEDYPEDKYGSSCLICGLTKVQRPIHAQCSYPSRSLIKLITVYEPDPQRWNDDFTQRRFSNNDK